MSSSSSSSLSTLPRTDASKLGALAAPAVGGLRVHRVPCLSDNYAWVVVDEATGATAVVDPAEPEPVASFVDGELGGRLDFVLNTHHHGDHVGGNDALVSRYGAAVVGAACDAPRIPRISVKLRDGDRFKLGESEAVCLETPGHTRGHVTFFFERGKALFPGDTLFALGCGRLFEGDGPTMWRSLSKLLPLPDDARVYCAHEYTQSNARWATSLDKGNELLLERSREIDDARLKGHATVPSLLGEEKRTNPFLRPGDASIRRELGVAEDASDAEAFTAIRKHKDRF